MDVTDVFNLLKKYGLYNDVQKECQRKKIDEIPYDMQGRYAVCCSFLSKKIFELRDKVNTLLKVKCSEFENIPDDPKPAHDDCKFVGVYCTQDYCKTNCKYYKENLAELFQEINTISEAQQVLKAAAKRDYYSK